MEDYSVKSFRLNVLGDIGSMNEVRIKKIKECLGPDFQSPTIIDRAVIVINPIKKCLFIIGPQQITFGMDGEAIDVPDFEYMQVKFTELFAGLLIDPVAQSGVQIVAHYVTAGSSMEGSFKFLAVPKSSLNTGMKNIAGVGLRLLTEEEGDTWEYKVEPFIKDPTCYFLEAVCGNKLLPLESILSRAKLAYTYFTNEWKDVFEEHLLVR